MNLPRKRTETLLQPIEPVHCVGKTQCTCTKKTQRPQTRQRKPRNSQRHVGRCEMLLCTYSFRLSKAWTSPCCDSSLSVPSHSTCIDASQHSSRCAERIRRNGRSCCDGMKVWSRLVCGRSGLRQITRQAQACWRFGERAQAFGQLIAIVALQSIHIPSVVSTYLRSFT
jgi:hypothetical protein